MGGNAIVFDKNGKLVNTQKIPLKEIGRQNVIKVIRQFFYDLNKLFEEKYNYNLWDENLIKSGFIFNGSASFVMNDALDDVEIEEIKPFVGDIDTIVSETFKKDLWEFFNKIQGLKINKNTTYIGNNKPNFSMVASQINAVFEIKFKKLTCLCQIDFEFLPFENGKPTEWAKFGHSSSFEDAKKQIKAVHHKFLIRSIAGSWLFHDVVIATNASTPDNIKISKSAKNLEPRMLSFSVDKGLRYIYEPFLDQNGVQVWKDDKKVYKEIASKNSIYFTNIEKIFKLCFGENSIFEKRKFESFIGIIELMKKFLDKEKIDKIHLRYLNLLWSSNPRAQELEKDNPKLDLEIKLKGYQYFIENLNLKDLSKDLIENYYKTY